MASRSEVLLLAALPLALPNLGVEAHRHVHLVDPFLVEGRIGGLFGGAAVPGDED